MIESIKITPDKIIILDQTLLPNEEKYIEINNYKQMIEAIKRLSIRGAPAIGIAAASGVYLASKEFERKENFLDMLANAISEIEASRPTAVNLFRATNEIKNFVSNKKTPLEITKEIYNYSQKLKNYELEACINMGINGLKTISLKDNLKILTHCNTGSLATYGIGTALGVIRTLAEKTNIHVFADETRPLLQGARLTMWELQKSNIQCTLISDNMAAATIRDKKIDCIITGADRIAKNGDSANKIGTFNLGILAKHFNIPFYIVAPESTIDRNIKTGDQIKIEQRNPEEVRKFQGNYSAPQNSNVFNPAFDVTPASLITAIITDKSVYKSPYSL